MSDRTSITALVSAETDADAVFTQMYLRHRRAIRDYCRRRVSGDAVDDAIAEVFLTAWRRLDDIPPGDGAVVWLYGVAYRVIGHHWRSSLRRRQLEDRLRWVVGPVTPGTDDPVIDEDDRRRALAAAARLGPTDAEMLRLSAWEQLCIADIAVVLEIAPNAVKQRLHRARRNLAREYRRLEARQNPAPGAAKGGAR